MHAIIKLISIAAVLSVAFGSPQREKSIDRYPKVITVVEERLEDEKVENKIGENVEIERVNTRFVKTVSCEEIVSNEDEPRANNHAACQMHCRTLGRMFTRGHCLKGICHCEKEEDQERTVETRRRQETSLGPRGSGSIEFFSENKYATVMCEHIEPLVEERKANIHEACSARCKSFGRIFVGGECVKGVCKCLERRSPSARPTHTEIISDEAKPIRCDLIIPQIGRSRSDNHEACLAHCKRVDVAHKEGRCVEGICLCGPVETVRPVQAFPVTVRVPYPTLERFPTVKCEHLFPLTGRPSSENHELCFAHCRSLGNEYIRGECHRGVCHCDKPRREERGYPTVKCEHIVPFEGRPDPENHEACSRHCSDISRRYLDGECVRGVCRCSLGSTLELVRSTSAFGSEELKRQG